MSVIWFSEISSVSTFVAAQWSNVLQLILAQVNRPEFGELGGGEQSRSCCPSG